MVSECLLRLLMHPCGVGFKPVPDDDHVEVIDIEEVGPYITCCRAVTASIAENIGDDTVPRF